jgi:hypothetical protein
MAKGRHGFLIKTPDRSAGGVFDRYFFCRQDIPDFVGLLPVSS